ncbi:MAG TPA: APC family permease [Pyrinomonadaceae bacterium]|nr:APC family permease [Pyrinomonadaceae bacterium]
MKRTAEGGVCGASVVRFADSDLEWPAEPGTEVLGYFHSSATRTSSLYSFAVHNQHIPLPETSSTPTNPRGRLLRVLGVGFGLAVIIGNTIGAGIFRTPGNIAQLLPNEWLFLGVWLVGGLYALLGATQIAELGTMLPRSGGQYVFARYALGEYAGFIVGWSDWISTCGSAAAVSLVVGEFAGALLPVLAGKTVVIATFVAIFFAVLQWRGVVWGSSVQNVTSLLKALAFLALIVAAFVWGGNSNTAATPVRAADISLLAAFLLSLQAVIYTYDGWTGVIYFSEEVETPARNVPRALFGGVLSVIAIYLLVNLALLYVLPIGKIAGQDFAAGAAATVVFGKYGDTVFRSLTILSMLSAINAYHLMSTRVLFAMSRDRLFANLAAAVSKGGTPQVALLLSTVVAVLIIFFGKKFETVITILAFFFVANYALSFLSVFVLRRREPERERPYRAWGYPVTTGIALLGSILFLVGVVASDTRNSLYALLLLAISYPLFRLLRPAARKNG